MKKKYLLICLGAGPSQTPLIMTAKNMGFDVIACDINEDAPGFEFADYQINVSTHNFKEVIKSILNIKNENFDINMITGVLNRSSGPPVISTSKISEYFSLPGVPFDSAVSIVNKNLLRKKSKEIGVDVPEFNVVDAEKMNPELKCNYPVVVKPALSLIGKSGISIVREEKELLPSIKFAKNSTINNKIIVETYLKGSDYCFIGFIAEGYIQKVCILEEINIENIDGSISGRGFKTLASSKEKIIEEKIINISNKIIDGFMLTRTPFMCSFRSDHEGKLYLMEIHLDIGGDTLIENLFPNALDIDFKELAVNMAAGKIHIPPNINVKPCAVIFDKGSQIVSKKRCKIISANTHEELDIIIENEK